MTEALSRRYVSIKRSTGALSPVCWNAPLSSLSSKGEVIGDCSIPPAVGIEKKLLRPSMVSK